MRYTKNAIYPSCTCVSWSKRIPSGRGLPAPGRCAQEHWNHCSIDLFHCRCLLLPLIRCVAQYHYASSITLGVLSVGIGATITLFNFWSILASSSAIRPTRPEPSQMYIRSYQEDFPKRSELLPMIANSQLSRRTQKTPLVSLHTGGRMILNNYRR